MSQNKSIEKSLETVKLSKTTTWSLDSSRKRLSKFLKEWAKSRDLSDEFIKIHSESMITTLYMANIYDKDKAFILLDAFKQDISGGSQILDNKLWGYKKSVYIICPNDKNLLTSCLFRNILKLAGNEKTQSQFSDVDLSETSDQNSFWNGFFSELYSVSPLKRIAPITDKSTMYANGVACMRYELFNIIRNENKHIKGQYWINIDKSVSGDPNKKTKKYLHIFLSTYVNGALLGRTLQQLISSYYSSFKGAITKRVSFSSFLKDGTETLAMLNRHKVEKQAIGKGKKTKTVSRKVIIKPTKPSRLATIFALERASISELCESAWENLEKLKEMFDKTIPLKRDYDSFTKKASELIKEQWDVKQVVLNCSKFRQGALNSKENSTSKRIQEMRKVTSSIEVINVDISKEIETLYINLFSKLKIKDEKGYYIPSAQAFIGNKEMEKRFPITYKLLLDLITLTGEHSRIVNVTKENSEELKQ